MSLGERIRDVLTRTSLTPRDLAAVTQIHYTTIYDAMKVGPEYTFRPVTERVLTEALDKLDALHDAGVLPFQITMSAKERQRHLMSLAGPDSV